MPGQVIQVEGASALASSLGRLETDLGDMAEAQQAAAAVIMAAAKAEAPRRTGRLAGSVRVGGSAKATATVVAGGPSVPYAGVIHYGSARRNIAPNPFMTRAVDRTEAQVQAIYEHDTQRLVDRVKGA